MKKKITKPSFDFYEQNKLKCQSSNKAQMICVNPQCQDSALICINQSCKKCTKTHKTCQINRLKFFMKKFSMKSQFPSPQIKKSYQAVSQVYGQIIKLIQKQRQQLTEIINYFGYQDQDIQFIKLIQNNQQKQLKGKLIFQIRKMIQTKIQYTPCYQRIMHIWQKHWKQQFNIHLTNIKLVPKQNKTYKINSKIIKNIQQVEQFFDQQCIYTLDLLYRATENDFSIAKFYQKCDGKQQIVIIARTNFKKIIGAYTSTACDSSNTTYQDQDAFLFSITNKTKLLPIKGISNLKYEPRSRSGPSFGDQQFTINDKQKKSFFNVGNIFNTQDFKYDTNQINDFSGKNKEDQNVIVQQWEVFQISCYK